MSKTLNLLAIDLGASNGKAILGRYNGKKIDIKNVYKFSNAGININNNIYWDILNIFEQVKKSIKNAYKESRGSLCGLAIDSWGVDYGLLDKNGSLLSFPYHYRDKRINGLMDEMFNEQIRKEIYAETGTQFLQLNTLIQLFADLKYRPWILENARNLLFIPDLINYFLTGQVYNELTISSTSQFLNPRTKKWSPWILRNYSLPTNILNPLISPGNILGELQDFIKDELNISANLSVLSAASHDTASAVAAIPFQDENSAYISSGTWSLMGLELANPIINQVSRAEGFTNELGVGARVRFLKNLCGLWLIQECKRIWNITGNSLSYQDISDLASQEIKAKFIVDPADKLFLNPPNMLEAIVYYCKKTNQEIPESIGEFARGIYQSLALSYKKNIDKLEVITGQSINMIHIVGGGSKVKLLSQLTADYTRKEVITGPVEASGMGNIITQLLGLGEINSVQEGRKLIEESISLERYYPEKEIKK